MKLTTKIFIGLLLGVIVGLVFSSSTAFINTWIKPFGILFINLIKMIIVPIVFASLIVGSASVGDVRKLSRMGGKTLSYYLVTTALAVTIGLIIANIINPGMGLTLPANAKYAGKEAMPISQVLLDIFPTNPVKALVDANMLQIIVFAIFGGIGITLVGERGKPVLSFFDGFAEIMYKITAIIMEFAPYGVFALITPVVAANGPKVLLPLAAVITAVYLACILHAVIVYSIVVKMLAGMSPFKFFKGFSPAMLIAFSTCSSSATLPVSMKSVEENLGVSKEVSSFVMPLGATINMDGTAIYQGVCAVFVAQVFGMDLTIGQMFTVILTATLASIGTAGVPGAGLIMLTMVLQSIGLPLEGIALIAGIDRILDMIRTTVNVTGDASAAVIINRSESKYLSQVEKVTA
ncbi:cation:dicarboxylase symporter family transporter [Thermanaerosceptrum fracticalcis]|uniref:Cation:dicarboxylase symporter family transporter n=1 Tax=Thermanaerosceptrum fracticalcis TaxID=1712410 RepID=A0A7G6E5G3_THEFR|nr:dicarboxylate/amino acid:cation symporter [Thermanaerosceptrum fracticalcis]QNB47317.1 cation:dicarboxylase symporter family transporter [Thermanaerosceptrum fracticalcis]